METKLPPCPVEVTLSVIGSKWKVLILRDLMPGTKRFGELESSLQGVSRKVLASTLKDMETQGLLTRRAYNEIPPRVEYDLTDLGRSLQPMLDTMMVWGEEYRAYANSRPE
ncbi:MAG: helix-turn-helix domain-containing protein [Thermoplasmata archaeon]|nr:helix-turn-helix domain-containing protein [Thermoplasmata archaeon]